MNSAEHEVGEWLGVVGSGFRVVTDFGMPVGTMEREIRAQGRIRQVDEGESADGKGEFGEESERLSRLNLVGNGGVGLENRNEVGRGMAEMADATKGISRRGDLTSTARRIEFAEKRRIEFRRAGEGGRFCWGEGLKSERNGKFELETEYN